MLLKRTFTSTRGEKSFIFKVEISTVIISLPKTIFTVLESLFLEMNFSFLQAARETCRKFLYEENGERVIMVTDPPFGGLVEALASSFKKLMAMWKETEKEGMYYSQIGGLCCNITLRKKDPFVSL